jgi:hypothetical protein
VVYEIVHPLEKLKPHRHVTLSPAFLSLHTFRRYTRRKGLNSKKLINMKYQTVDDPAPSVPNREQLRREEINFNAFLAKACARSRIGSSRSTSSGATTDAADAYDPTDMPLYAVWALRRALEDADWTAPDAASAIDPQYDAETKARLTHLATVHVLDGYVAPAAQWVFHAGRRLYDICSRAGDKSGDKSGGEADNDDDDDDDAAAAGGGQLWTGGAGFSRARWAFWKQRFAWASEQRELAEGTRDVARAAADAMERIEREAGVAAHAEK